MLSTTSDLSQEQLQMLLEEAKKRGMVGATTGSLWPKEMSSLLPSCFMRFLAELQTWNEADKETQHFPDAQYLHNMARLWIRCYKDGTPLVVEKCRRMVASWLFRALELWAYGMQRQDGLIVGLDLESAAKHCWRYQFMYEGLQKRHKEWKLQDLTIIRHRGERQVSEVFFPNGSRAAIMNQESTSFPGEGYGLVCCEELSRYRNASEIWSQALIVTQGAAGSKGGFVSSISNANGENETWREIKNGLV